MATRLRIVRSAAAFLLGATLCAPTPASTVAASWTTGASFTGPLTRGSGVWFAPNSRFYVLGGRSSDVAGSDYVNPREYDPVGNAWVVKAGVFPDNQVNNMVCAVLTQGGTPYVFCVGGSAAGATTCTSAVRRYDPIADAIVDVTSDPWSGAPANTLPGGGAVHGNKLYVLGGFVINAAMSAEIWEFDPDAAAGSRWTLKTAALPVALGYVPAATIGSKIYMAGGSTWNGTTILDSANSFAYDPVADTIATIATTPRATAETRAVNEGGRMWVLGGGRVAPNPSTQVDDYAPGTDTWSLGPPFTIARRNVAADVDPATGDIYMVGGYAPAVATDSLEILLGSITPGAPFCEPGVGGIMACACGNPNGPGVGCANTGSAGASLGSLGSASLASDFVDPGSVTLTGTSMLSGSSCIFLQGNAPLASGAPFGAGIRCAGGTLKRLYLKPISGGAQTVPQAADRSISNRSSDLGDPIASSSTRWYQTYYRDPSLANPGGGCPTVATYNVTSGQAITWGP